MPSFKFELAYKPARFSDRQILQGLRDFARRHHNRPFTTAQFDHSKDRPFCSLTVTKRFGSWPEALKRAGIKGAKPHRIPAEALIKNLEQVWRKLGRPPGTHTLPIRGRFSASAYRSRWGSVRRACELLAKHHQGHLTRNELVFLANHRRTIHPRATELRAASQCDRSKTPRQARRSVPTTPTLRRTPRNIPLGLRYQVLKRDNYRCLLCGHSPATNPAIQLHIDHILPKSRGGPNHLSNLRTLCQDCNLGRGAGRHEPRARDHLSQAAGHEGELTGVSPKGCKSIAGGRARLGERRARKAPPIASAR